MSGRTRAGAGLAAAAVLCLCGSAAASAAARPGVARPNPALTNAQLDYVEPLAGVSGGPASLAPLEQAVIAQAVADELYLRYRSVGDLGGFVPAQVRASALSSGGRSLVGAVAGSSEIPQLAQAADGEVESFAAAGSGTFAPPDQGRGPLTPPSNTNTVPPPNQGFGGTPPPQPPPPTTTTRTTPTTTRTTPQPPPTTPPTTTTTTTTTTTPATTSAATTTAAPPATPPAATTTASPPAPPFVGASCGTAGLTITSDHATCRISAANMAPGGSASEVMTIRNDTSAPFTLSLQAAGTQTRLWSGLRMGVWEAGTGAPSPLPPLLFWTAQANTLATLAPGASIRYEIELYLPSTRGNVYQGLTATIDLVWAAQG